MNPETFYRDTEMCRVCPRTENLKHLYDSSNEEVLSHLKLIISIDDEKETLLPRYICQTCTASVKNFTDLKRQCEDWDKEMRENIGNAKQNIKKESSDIFDTKTDQINDEIENYDFIEKFEPELEIESDIFNELVEEDTMEDIETDEDSIASDSKPILPKKRPITEIKTSKAKCRLKKCTGHGILDDGSIAPCKIICKFCDKDFLSISKLKEHQEANHKECPDCLGVYPTHFRMLKHYQRHHPKPKVVTKETCLPKKLPKTDKYKCKQQKCTGHSILDDGSIAPCKFICKFCDEEFTEIEKLKEHQESDHKTCPCCLKVYPTYFRMQDHHQRYHKKVPKVVTNETFPCELCDKVFKHKANVSRHVRSFHNNERLHHCETCGMGFFELAQLKSHLLKHTEDRPVFCDVPGCGKTYKSVEGLRTHKICHLPLRKKLHVRAVARKRFYKKPRYYICSYCGKSLKGITSITMHQRIHTNEKPHECNICSAKFRCTSSLNSHLRTHTNYKPHPCGICNKNFRTKTHLTTHSLVHKDEKPFSCEICNMTTKYKFNLDAHMRDIHRVGENIVPCAFCEEIFLSINARNKHTKIKHKDAQSTTTE